MRSPTRSLSLADYHPVAPVRRDARLKGKPVAVFDGHTVWVSPAIESLYRDRTDAEFWLFMCRSVDVVTAPSIDLWVMSHTKKLRR